MRCTRSLGRKTHISSQRPKEVVQEIYGLLLEPKSCTVINFSSSKQRRCFTIASFFYWNITSYSSRSPKITAVTTTRPSLFLSWLTWEIISNPVASELFISVFSPSAFSAPSAVKSFRCNRKRYYRSNYTGKSERETTQELSKSLSQNSALNKLSIEVLES